MTNKKRKLKILLVEDSPLFKKAFETLLVKHELEQANSIDEFLQKDLAAKHFDVIFLDLSHAKDPGGERALQKIPFLKSIFSGATLFVQSATDRIDLMKRSIALGASQFISKANLEQEIPRILADADYYLEQSDLFDELFVGASKALLELKRELIFLKKKSPGDLYLEGESGTGKELCAQFLATPLKMLEINASAIPPDLFESEFFGFERGSFTGAQQPKKGFLEAAENGFLFFDEVQSLASSHQAKILKVLESRNYFSVGSTKEKRFEGRFLFAANRNLLELTKTGQFREDLYYRISLNQIKLVPLRNRPEDIPPLAQSFMDKADPTHKFKLTTSALDFLKTLDWPGNVRELRNVITEAVRKSKIPLIDESAFTVPALELTEPRPDSTGGFSVKTEFSFDENIAALEKYLLTKAIGEFKEARKVQEALKISKTRFYEKIKQYELTKEKG